MVSALYVVNLERYALLETNTPGLGFRRQREKAVGKRRNQQERTGEDRRGKERKGESAHSERQTYMLRHLASSETLGICRS